MSDTRVLAPSREHLATHRRMIIARALATALAGAVPVPVFEDWLSARVMRGTISRIADRRGVDLDEAALHAIADGKTSAPDLGRLTGTTLLYKLATGRLRKLALAYLATQRARSAARSFTVATLFDHYCSRLHVGAGLDGESARAVRAAMDEAIALTPGRLGTRPFRRGLLAAARATMRAPVEVLDIATGGALRRLLGSGREEVTTVEEVDDAIERSLASEGGFLRRAVTAVERQLSASTNPYVDNAVSVFEDLWRARNRPAGAGPGPGDATS